MKNILVVMKSVRRNAELTSFTFSTSAAAHIINIMVWSYSSSSRQHTGERCGMQGGGQNGGEAVMLWTARAGLWSLTSSWK